MIEIHLLVAIISILVSYTIGYFVAVSEQFTKDIQSVPLSLFKENEKLRDSIKEYKETIHNHQEKIAILEQELDEYRNRFFIENI